MPKAKLLLGTVLSCAALVSKAAVPERDLSAQAQPAPTYCNPLPLPEIPLGKYVREQHRETNSQWLDPATGAYRKFVDKDRWMETDGQDYREMADPTMFADKGRWYLFPSSLTGPLWASDDLVHWTHHSLGLNIAYAPTVVRKGEWLYLTASGSRMVWRAKDVLGPWQELGPMKDCSGKPKSCMDPCLFVDDDGAMYVYYGGNAWVARLRDEDPTTFAEEPTLCFRFNPENAWERGGTHNQDVNRSWTEGTWITKHQGKYYLTFSACGTQYKTYAVGCYIGDTPRGPWRPQKRNPILVQRGGLLNGTAHHSIFAGPAGTLWCVYTVLVRNTHLYERRVAMDPVGFDANGEMFVAGPTETPQLAPGVLAQPALGNDAGWLNLSADPQHIRASSSAAGREPVYACDDTLRTWWEAAGPGPQWLEVDLDSLCQVQAFRTVFADRGLNARTGVLPGPYRYRIEGTADGKDWLTLVDQSCNTTDLQIAYETCKPAHVRFVRLTVLQAPKGMRIALWEFTAFGTVLRK